MNLLSQFRFNLIGIEVESDAFDYLCSRLEDLQSAFDFAKFEEPNASSGAWTGLFFGYPASYVAVTKAKNGHPKDCTVALQATTTGLVSQAFSLIRGAGFKSGLETVRLLGEGGDSMAWYESIETEVDSGPLPVFLDEFCTEYLEDIGLSAAERDQIGRDL